MRKTLHQSIGTTTDYAYINARIRGMRSELLSVSQYQELKGCKNFDETLEVLKGTRFSKYFQLLQENPSPNTLEEMFRRDLFETTQDILRLIEGEPLKLLEALLLYWDAQAVRTVLRGKFANRPSLEILLSTLPAGKLNEPLLKELAEAPDVKSLIQILYLWKFPLGRALMRVLPRFQETQELIVLEHALEKSFFREMTEKVKELSQEKQALGQFLSLLKDLFNVRSALRIREQRLPLAQGVAYFLDKGNTVGKNLFIAILQQETSESACQLISTALGIPQKPKDEFTLERCLDQKIFQEGIRKFLGDPLGFDLIFGFLWLKIAEIQNLRVIIRGKAAGIGPEKLEEELIHV